MRNASTGSLTSPKAQCRGNCSEGWVMSGGNNIRVQCLDAGAPVHPATYEGAECVPIMCAKTGKPLPGGLIFLDYCPDNLPNTVAQPTAKCTAKCGLVYEPSKSVSITCELNADKLTASYKYDGSPLPTDCNPCKPPTPKPLPAGINHALYTLHTQVGFFYVCTRTRNDDCVRFWSTSAEDPHRRCTDDSYPCFRQIIV